MSFKVVFIKELNEIEAVPAEWEDNNILYWPTDEKMRKLLQSNKNSFPNKLTWNSYNCLVKSSNILIYGDATKEAQWYLNNSTEDESDSAKKKKKNPARRLHKDKLKKKYNFQHLLPHKIDHATKEPNANQNFAPPAQLSAMNSQIMYSLPTCTVTGDQLLQSSQGLSGDTQQFVPVSLNSDHLLKMISSQSLDNARIQPQQFSAPQSSTTNEQYKQLINSALSLDRLQNVNNVVIHKDEFIEESQLPMHQQEINSDQENVSPNNQDLAYGETEEQSTILEEFFPIDFESKIKTYIDESFQNFSKKLTAAFNTRFDNIEKLITKNDMPVVINKCEEKLPLLTIEEVEKFESKLQDNTFFMQMLFHLKKVNGSGQLWRSSCYKLCDYLFDKNLLTLYTWTGQTRKDTIKQQFNKLTNILNLFYEVICYADSTFSHKLKDEFFRDGVLKHSIERSKPKKKRERKNKQKSSINCPSTATTTPSSSVGFNSNNNTNNININSTNIVIPKRTAPPLDDEFNDGVDEKDDDEYDSSSSSDSDI